MGGALVGVQMSFFEAGAGDCQGGLSSIIMIIMSLVPPMTPVPHVPCLESEQNAMVLWHYTTALHYISLRDTSYNYCYNCNYATVQYVTFDCALQYRTLHSEHYRACNYIPPPLQLQYTTINCATPHYIQQLRVR